MRIQQLRILGNAKRDKDDKKEVERSIANSRSGDADHDQVLASPPVCMIVEYLHDTK